MNDLKVGDIVKFKLNGPNMLVATVYSGVSVDGPMVECCWFDTNQVFHKEAFRTACLEPVSVKCTVGQE